MRWIVSASAVGGTASVPGDKSIGHRALMLAALAPGASTIRGLSSGEDIASTMRCLRALGVEITRENGELTVCAPNGLQHPASELDAGNSGTTMRLLSGIVAGHPFVTSLSGDESLRTRPMKRVIDPLTAMGARIASREGYAPLTIEGGNLRAIHYTSPVASAQVKSCILLAGLRAAGETSIQEPHQSRDHTERMLAALGVPLHIRDGIVHLLPATPRTLDMTIPGDLSSAAFLFAAALLTRGEVTVTAVGVNPTRTGILEVMESMGAHVDIQNARLEGGEPVGDVTVSGAIERPIDIRADLVPSVIDELPLIALLATQAPGVSTVRDAHELRIKESDRISTVADALTRLGAQVSELPDGFTITGRTPLHGARVSSHGDHRLAMVLAVAGTIARGQTVVDGAEAAAVSFPTFAPVFASLGASIDA